MIIPLRMEHLLVVLPMGILDCQMAEVRWTDNLTVHRDRTRAIFGERKRELEAAMECQERHRLGWQS